MLKKYWKTPNKRSVGLFTDLRLYYEALNITRRKETVTKAQLTEDLSKRVKGLIFIEKLSGRVIYDLIRELINFGWLRPKKAHTPSFTMTENGIEAMSTFQRDRHVYLEILILKMQNVYTIPGWFVNRLWDLNPEGQGEVIVPAPPRKWNPQARQWEDKEWTDELSEQVLASRRIIRSVCSGGFPFNEQIWFVEVQKSWLRLSHTVRRRTVARPRSEEKEKGKMKTYAPRRRLANAMKEAAVNLMFGNQNPQSRDNDFTAHKQPLSTRLYMAWCPRLAELGLIFYTDFHPSVPGRLIFPVSAFKKTSRQPAFRVLDEITNPSNEMLSLHQPNWKQFKTQFLTTLYVEHQKVYATVKSFYVSIFDVRDEVCRQLRISADCFDSFLKNAIGESLSSGKRYAISLETDVREDQSSAYQRIRRPVVMDGTQFSLIALTKTGH